MPTQNAKRILITAGEPSGDRLGAALMAALKSRHPNIKFIGTGGEQMIGQGLQPLFPMSDLAVMGLFEVLPAIPRILKRLKQLTALAQAEQPDLIITIDSQDFSTRLAKSLKSSNPHTLTPTPHLHYVAPKTWAWRPHRAQKLPSLYTHLLTILPFEEQFFNKLKTQNAERKTPFATYVGHPATTTLAPFTAHRLPASPALPTLALLPGSRTTELHRHWPVFLQTYRQLCQQMPELTAVLALPSERALQTCQSIAPWNDSDAITPTFGEARFPHLGNATAALTKSGTNNLELAILGVPAVVTYRMNALTYFLAKYLIKVPFISLPNLILHYAGHQPVYPELIQSAVTPKILLEALQPLLQETSSRKTQNATLKTFNSLMQTPKPPAVLAADIVTKYLK